MKMFTVIACFVLSIPGVFASPTPLELEAKKLEKRYCRTGGEFCMLIPIPMPCCLGYECSSITGGHCKEQ
ncbi:hypothetical protein FS749_001479 [Ceratobasidium sp. UAMH 11750]|nr:hypothetical protein FS749_001479 [Ceratobasidium sp. UAMH 11750]